MSRSARKTQSAAAATIEVSPKQLLAAHRQGTIVLKKAERTAFRGPLANTPVILRLDQPMGQAMAAWLASKAQHTTQSAATPPAEVEAILTAPVVEAPTIKKAKAAKKVAAPVEVEAPKVKRATKGEGKSRTPEARKARRILREYLRVSLVATDENEDEEIRAIAQARSDYLEQLIGASV